MSGITIEKLLGRSNYSTWKLAAQATLDLDDLWCTIEYEKDEEGNPKTPVDPNKDRKARSKLTLMIDTGLYTHIADAKTAKQLWDALAKTYDDTGLDRRIKLLNKLTRAQLVNCKNMEEYVDIIISTSQQLNGVGLVVSEEWVGSFLLAGLPSSYRPMIMAIEHSGIKLTGDAIKNKLLQEDEIPDDEQAFSVKKKDFKCHFCGKFGHTKKNCWKNPENKRNEASGGAFHVVLSTVDQRNKQDWYFDSGASSHMVKSLDILNHVRKVDGSVVAADGKNMKIKYIGSVKINHSSKNGPPTTVNDVQVVPELTTNLLSVSKIVKNGNTVTFSNKGCIVRNEKGETIATGSLCGDLFKLDQQVQVETTVCNKVESTSLSQRRMGKMSRFKYNKHDSRENEMLEVVHSDIYGPTQAESWGRRRYFITFTDDKSRKICGVVVKSVVSGFFPGGRSNKVHVLLSITHSSASGPDKACFTVTGSGAICENLLQVFESL